MSEVESIVRRSRQVARTLQALSCDVRNGALRAVHDGLSGSRDALLEANDSDKASATSAQKSGHISSALLKRLDLSGRKFDALLEGVKSVERLEDPVGAVTLARRLDKGLDLYRVSCPIGVIAVIFEARPEAAVQISCLAIKSGNAVILKGGKEGERSNVAIVSAIRAALVSVKFPQDAVQLVSTREQVRELLDQDRFVDLIIPRGSNDLVRYITNNTRIPVMGHADGICTVYIDGAADVRKACDIAVDSKAQYPAVCNAAETLLIDRKAISMLSDIGEAMAAAGVQLRADDDSRKILETVPGLQVSPSSAMDYDTEFLELVMAVKVVDGVDAAIEHINRHGSGHTDCIVTEDSDVAKRFLAGVDSAGVYHNASTRFADGFRYGFGAEVGVSTNRTHARGPVGLEGLMIYKYKLFGAGHTVAPYVNGESKFAHEDLEFASIDKR